MKSEMSVVCGMLKRFGVCQFVAFLLYITGAVVTAMLIHLECIEISMAGYGSAIGILVGSIVSGLLVSSMNEDKKLVFGTINSAVTLGIILLIKVLFFHGELSGLFAITTVIIGGNLAAILVHGRKNKNRRGKRKYAYW